MAEYLFFLKRVYTLKNLKFFLHNDEIQLRVLLAPQMAKPR